MTFKTISAPSGGLYRIARSAEPYRTSIDPTHRDPGNRFDPDFVGVPVGVSEQWRSLYFASTGEACFAEVLATFRLSPEIRVVDLDEDDGNRFMEVGSIPQDWRDKRVLVRVRVGEGEGFVDFADPETFREMERRYGSDLEEFGIDQMDLSVITSRNRALTRRLATRVAFDDEQLSGIAYASRLGGDRVCWAVFARTDFAEVERHAISRDNPDLVKVAKHFNLVVH